MRHGKSQRIISIAFLVIAFATPSNAMVSAQTKLQGVIMGRSGAEIILQTADSPKMIVLLTDSTDVAQVVVALSQDADHGPHHPMVSTSRRDLRLSDPLPARKSMTQNNRFRSI